MNEINEYGQPVDIDESLELLFAQVDADSRALTTQDCWECHGSGYIEVGANWEFYELDMCPSCHGTGRVELVRGKK